MTAAVLSITARAKRREAAHSKSSQAAPPANPAAGTTSASTTTAAAAPAPEKMEVDEPGTEKNVDEKKMKDEKDNKPKEEPNFEILANPARVVRQQVSYFTLIYWN